METLHPQWSGYGHTWRRDLNAIQPEQYVRGSNIMDEHWQKSPMLDLIHRAQAGEHNPTMRRRLELGLHLEAAPATNERIATGLARQLLVIKARLGERLDLEPWDRGWVRLYETHPVEVFDAARVKVTAARMAELIGVIWPMCQELRKRDARIGLAERV